MKKIMSGNEAIARGAYEDGVKIAAANPGTPSTEILKTIAHEYKDIYAEWSTNEKVAWEVACGSSMAGARAILLLYLETPTTHCMGLLGAAQIPPTAEVNKTNLK